MLQSELADQIGYNNTVIWKSINSSEALPIAPRRGQRLNATKNVASITARQQGQFLEGVTAWYTAVASALET